MRTAGVTRERKPVELLLAGDVLDRLIGKAALNQRVKRGLLRGRELAFGFGELRGVGDSQRVAKQKRGIAGCIGAQIRIALQLVRAVLQSVAKHHACSLGPGPFPVLTLAP